MTEQSSDDRRDPRDRDFQQQVLEGLNQLSNRVDTLSNHFDRLSDRVDNLSDRFDKLSGRVDKLSSDGERFNDRFSDYQQATQWVVQLAFTLIASATITVILTTVFKR
jgi:chaperonin cofactor prefoldin